MNKYIKYVYMLDYDRYRLVAIRKLLGDSPLLLSHVSSHQGVPKSVPHSDSGPCGARDRAVAYDMAIPRIHGTFSRFTLYHHLWGCAAGFFGGSNDVSNYTKDRGRSPMPGLAVMDFWKAPSLEGNLNQTH